MIIEIDPFSGREQSRGHDRRFEGHAQAAERAGVPSYLIRFNRSPPRSRPPNRVDCLHAA
jgi:hypothetical protein